jgi:UDP-N-acetylglucosamine 4,6-dehydratase/5-epimerase
MLNNKTVLITGGTGSFGKGCAIYLLKKFNLKKLIIFSRDELKQFHMSNELENIKKNTKLRFFLGDVRDRERLFLAFKKVDYVIHAAALKQITAAEYNPQECIKTNIHGAENVIYAAIERQVKRVIALSTDKACNPINLYGATKLASDKLFISSNELSGPDKTIFSVVRYGNVINSRGSVIPLFREINQSKNKKFPLTHPDMTRFFITLEQSVEFVINSFKRMRGGEIFIPKLSSVKIIDIIKAINSKPKLNIIGIRQGEKMHEILGGKDEARNTLEYDNHYVLLPNINGGNKRRYLIDPLTKKKGNKVSENFEYVSSSANERLTINSIRKMLNNLNKQFD